MDCFASKVAEAKYANYKAEVTNLKQTINIMGETMGRAEPQCNCKQCK